MADPGDLPVSSRLDALEVQVREHDKALTKASAYVAMVLAVAALIPITTFLIGILKKGDAGADGADGRDGISAPIGAVVAWLSTEPPPPDWLPCDGRELPSSDCTTLSNLLGSRYGTPSPNMVRLPDMRGFFLRGWLGDRKPITSPIGGHVVSLDPDSSRRYSPDDMRTVVGNQLGSIQLDGANLSPGDGFPAPAGENPCYWGPMAVAVQQGNTHTGLTRYAGYRESQTKDTGSSETRPKNMAVQWIIRVR